jgi:hypothetical protein
LPCSRPLFRAGQLIRRIRGYIDVVFDFSTGCFLFLFFSFVALIAEANLYHYYPMVLLCIVCILCILLVLATHWRFSAWLHRRRGDTKWLLLVASRETVTPSGTNTGLSYRDETEVSRLWVREGSAEECDFRKEHSWQRETDSFGGVESSSVKVHDERWLRPRGSAKPF